MLLSVLNDSFDSMILILFFSGLMNIVLVCFCLKLTVENQKLKTQLFARERWHEKELQRWRQRL